METLRYQNLQVDRGKVNADMYRFVSREFKPLEHYIKRK